MSNQTTAHGKPVCDAGAMLNAYPDSMGRKLSDIVALLQKPELTDAFRAFYILPSVFHSDLDRGFSVIDYELNETMASKADLDALKYLAIALKLDFVLNHSSVLSPPFRDILKRTSLSTGTSSGRAAAP